MTNMIRSLLLLVLLPALGLAQKNWQLQNTNFPSNVSVESFSAVNNQVCWGIGEKIPGLTTPYPGYIRTTNGGTTWVCDSIPGATGVFFCQIAALNADTAYVTVNVNSTAANSKGVHKTTDGGVTWTHQNAYSSSSMGPTYIHFFDANNGVVIGDNDETYVTTNGGLTWNHPTSMPAAVANEWSYLSGSPMAVAGNCVWFSTGIRVFRSTDRGNTWSATTVNTAYTQWDPSLAFQDSMNGIYSVANVNPARRNYWKTTDGGVTWNPLTNSVIDSMVPTCICYVPGTRGTYLIGGDWSAGRGLACTYNAGVDWTLIDTTGIFDLVFLSDSIGWGTSLNTNAVYKYIGPRLVTSVENGITVPASYLLEQNYPNPFNPTTVISYQLPVSSYVTLKIFDLLGREVVMLLNERKDAGVYEVKFDASKLASGVYFYRIEATSVEDPSKRFVETKKMILLR